MSATIFDLFKYHRGNVAHPLKILQTHINHQNESVLTLCILVYFQSLSDMSEIDIESYQSNMENVLTWLLEAESHLDNQEPISANVDEVKEQFHTHEVGVRCVSFLFRVPKITTPKLWAITFN